MKFKRKDIYAIWKCVNIAIPVISCFAKNKENSPNVRNIRIHNMSITHLIFINVSKRSNSKYPKNRIYLWQGIRRLEIRVEWMNSGVRLFETEVLTNVRKIHRVFFFPFVLSRTNLFPPPPLLDTSVISNITLSRARMSGLSDFPHAVVPTVERTLWINNRSRGWLHKAILSRMINWKEIRDFEYFSSFFFFFRLEI